MKKRILLTMTIAILFLFSHIVAERTFSQPLPQNTISQGPAISTASTGDKTYEIVKKLEMLEYKLETETKALEKRYDDFSKSATLFMSILSIFVALLTVFSIYKSLQQHKDYIAERGFLVEQTKNIQDRERPFEQRQLENIEKLNSVISLVEKTFDLQHKREEKQSHLVDELANMKKIVEQFEKESEERYVDAKELILSLADVKAMEWPNLPNEVQNITAKARNKFEEVSRVVLMKEERQHPYEIAKVYQLIGISSFYSNDIASAFKQLSEADRIYENNTPRPEDTMSRAYTKHFLGVAAKNWRRMGDVERGNVNEAYEHLSKADVIVKDDKKQFLIPVTLAEILSYRSDKKQAADKVNEIIKRFETLEINNEELDANQLSLWERLLLIKGNIEMTVNEFDDAELSYRKVFEKNKKNVFAHLSLLAAQKSTDNAEWQEALSLLERSGAIRKKETITKVIAIAWAIIAAHEVNDAPRVERYLNDLKSIGATLLHIAHREPLFFSPLSKNIEEFATLKDQLSKYIATNRPS
jgi:tetratricopeptide (TPR) repeat protein